MLSVSQSVRQWVPREVRGRTDTVVSDCSDGLSVCLNLASISRIAYRTARTAVTHWRCTDTQTDYRNRPRCFCHANRTSLDIPLALPYRHIEYTFGIKSQNRYKTVKRSKFIESSALYCIWWPVINVTSGIRFTISKFTGTWLNDPWKSIQWLETFPILGVIYKYKNIIINYKQLFELCVSSVSCYLYQTDSHLSFSITLSDPVMQSVKTVAWLELISEANARL